MYKRQVIGCRGHDFRFSELRQRQKHSTLQSHRGIELTGKVLIHRQLRHLLPVSYTHLDVYKRQDFIAKVPTVFDETVELDGEVGEYLTLARRKGDVWYIASYPTRE